MKAVVLARGLARRMREDDPGAALEGAQAAAAAAGQKAMMPIAGRGSAAAPVRPFLDFVLDALADAGCTRIALVIGPDHEEIRRRYVCADGVSVERLTIDALVQREPIGTANAVLAAEAWAGADPFLVINGDNLYPVAAIRALVDLGEPGLPAFERDALVRESNIPSDRVGSFALLDVGDDGYLRKIAEKPGPEAMRAAGGSALVSMNCWRFDARIFAACRDVPVSSRGEYELPQAVGLALSRDVRFKVVRASGEVLDLSRRGDVAAVSARLAGREVRL
jgi:glucose-1-phosphate thymidylyltransferase